MSWIRDLRADLAAHTPPDCLPHRQPAYRLVWALVFSCGFQFCLFYRSYAALHGRTRLGRLLARLLFNLSTVLFGCHVHPGARIGRGLLLPNPTGIVLGPGVVLGDGVTLCQHVTLGPGSDAATPQYPEVGDGVVLYAGCVVAGPVRIGAGARIGANAVVLKDIPGGATAVGAPARIVLPRDQRFTTGTRVG